MEKSYLIFGKRTRVMQTSGLAYKNTSSQKHIVNTTVSDKP